LIIAMPLETRLIQLCPFQTLRLCAETRLVQSHTFGSIVGKIIQLIMVGDLINLSGNITHLWVGEGYVKSAMEFRVSRALAHSSMRSEGARLLIRNRGHHLQIGAVRESQQPHASRLSTTTAIMPDLHDQGGADPPTMLWIGAPGYRILRHRFGSGTRGTAAEYRNRGTRAKTGRTLLSF
jgi:hypothetical protein